MDDLTHLCGASATGLATGWAVGPCVLRAHHDGRVHQAASGVTWTPAEPEATAEVERLRKELAKAESAIQGGLAHVGNVLAERDALKAALPGDVASQIAEVEAERTAMPEDERRRHEAADAPLLRLQLAGWYKQAKESEAEVERLRKERDALRDRVLIQSGIHNGGSVSCDAVNELLQQAQAGIAAVRRLAQVWVDIRPTHPTATRDGHTMADAGQQVLAALRPLDDRAEVTARIRALDHPTPAPPKGDTPNDGIPDADVRYGAPVTLRSPDTREGA